MNLVKMTASKGMSMGRHKNDSVYNVPESLVTSASEDQSIMLSGEQRRVNDCRGVGLGRPWRKSRGDLGGRVLDFEEVLRSFHLSMTHERRQQRSLPGNISPAGPIVASCAVRQIAMRDPSC